MRNILQSLFFAFVYNPVGTPMAAGLVYPFFGVVPESDDRDNLGSRNVGVAHAAAAATDACPAPSLQASSE